ncbi:hypothetical protein CAEBREN_19824 [Caenorhabditis brenneri]|uniref:Uncharacterized protein n=1 Tax=Caenorhabditis brenneri TaxID=135651 RepID=G0NXM4_CAEBE|nr:hypothetical protein CAEBREN_19824 [Caenorhabditis brenneri]
MADNMKLAVVAYVPYQGLAYFQHIRPVIVDLLVDAEAREVAHEATQEDGAIDTSEWNDHEVVESGHPPTDVRGHGPISPIMETPTSSGSNFSVNDNFDVATPERMDISAKEETEDCSVDHELVENVLKPAKSPQETLMDSTDPQDVGDKPEDEDQDLLEAVQNGVDLAADGTTQAETPHASQPVDKVQDEKLDVFSRHTLSQGYYTSYYSFVRLI